MTDLMTLSVGKVRLSTLGRLRDRIGDSDSASAGLGFIMLLSGEPGVGKTLTAESGSLPHALGDSYYR